MRILNLYAGLGGNRELWNGHEITAVEIDSEIARIYQSRFPNDTVITGDAHDFLLNHYYEFDFIWSSPPCPTHGQYRYNVGFRAKGYKAVFPDMKLYEEIIFLNHYFRGVYVVENVKPFYEPLIEPTFMLQRHLFWASSIVHSKTFEPAHLRTQNKISDFGDLGAMVAESRIKNKRQALRNCLDPEIGDYIIRSMTEVVPMAKVGLFEESA